MLGPKQIEYQRTPSFTTKKGGQCIGLLFIREVLQRHGLAFRLTPGATGETRFDIWTPEVAKVR